MASINQKFNIVCITNEQGKELAHFTLKDDLDAAVDLLKKINRAKDYKGTSILEYFKYNLYSAMSFWQEEIFWKYLRPYVKFKPVIVYLLENKIDKLEIIKLEETFVYFLRLFGLVEKSGHHLHLKMFRTLNILLARSISYLAILWALKNHVRILIYTPDKVSSVGEYDFRFAPVYEYLQRRGTIFIEIFHTLLGREFLKNLFRRRRLAIYIESFNPIFFKKNKWCKFQFDVSTREFSLHDGIVFNNLFLELKEKYYCSLRLITRLKKILAKARFTKLIAIDDTRSVNELLVACRENEIITYGIQHGHYTQYLTGYMNFEIPPQYAITFDKLFVWTKYWEDVLLRFSSCYNQSNVTIGGVLRKQPDFKTIPRTIKDLSELKLMVLSEPLSNKIEVGQYLKDFIKLGVQVYLSVRPDDNKKNPLTDYGLEAASPVVLVSKINEDVLREMDAVAGTYSTFLHEALFFDKPILLLQTSFNHGRLLLDDGLALEVKKGEYGSILGYINNNKSRKEMVWPSNSPDFTSTLDKILDGWI